jgi:hypothetical protein
VPFVRALLALLVAELAALEKIVPEAMGEKLLALEQTIAAQLKRKGAMLNPEKRAVETASPGVELAREGLRPAVRLVELDAETPKPGLLLTPAEDLTRGPVHWIPGHRIPGHRMAVQRMLALQQAGTAESVGALGKILGGRLTAPAQ